jgi:FkbM family methyltransferase
MTWGGLQSHGEGHVDRIVLHQFFFAQSAHGVIVDVGAAGPDYLSVSALYRALGWRVLAIEPNPAFCAEHRKKGYEVLPYACGDRDEDNVEFQVVDSHGDPYGAGKISYEAFSSLAIKDAYRSIKKDIDTSAIRVNLRRLDTILHAHAPDLTSIDILAIDVEGWELEVLRGLSVEKYRPRVIIIENLFKARRYWEDLKKRGYLLWKRIPPNEIYARRELFAPPEQARLDLYGMLRYWWKKK